jgi:hypothetical protein
LRTKSARSSGARARNDAAGNVVLPAWVLLAVLLAPPFLFLFARLSPPEVAPPCFRPVTISGWAHFVHACDSYTFGGETVDLQDFLIDPDHYLRGRLGDVIVGESMAAVLRPVALPIRPPLVEG